MNHILGRQLACEPGAKHPKENVVALACGAPDVRIASLVESIAAVIDHRARFGSADLSRPRERSQECPRACARGTDSRRPFAHVHLARSTDLRTDTDGDPPTRLRIIEAPVELGPEFLTRVRAADWLVLLATTATESLADAYGTLKYVSARNIAVRAGVVIVGVRNEREAELAAARLTRTARAFLGRNVRFLGCVPVDDDCQAVEDRRLGTGRIRPPPPRNAAIEAIGKRPASTGAPPRRVAAWWSSVASIFL